MSAETVAPETTTEPENAAPAEPTPPPNEQEPALVPTSGKAPMLMGERGVQLRSFAELWRFSQMALSGGAAPKGMKTVGQVAVAIQTGMEAGLTPMHSLQAVVVINGNTSWRGQSALGLIRAHPSCRYIKAWSEGRGDQMKGVCVSKRVGEAEERRTEFTVEQARTAGLWGKRGRDGESTPWVTYPDRQLMWRAVGFHTKDWWSEILGGFPLAEEAQDYPAREEAHVRPSAGPAPSSPDPLLSDTPAASAVIDVTPVASAEPAKPAEPTPTPKDCGHPNLPPSRLKPGKTMVCVDCGEELTGDPVQ